MLRVLLVAILAAGAVAAPAGAATLVTYSSGGGLAGRSAELRVDRDGRARLREDGDTKRFRLSRAMRRGLQADLRAARLRDCAASYAPDRPVADGITQRVRAQGVTVTVATGGDPPRRLERLLGRLQRIVARH